MFFFIQMFKFFDVLLISSQDVFAYLRLNSFTVGRLLEAGNNDMLSSYATHYTTFSFFFVVTRKVKLHINPLSSVYPNSGSIVTAAASCC